MKKLLLALILLVTLSSCDLNQDPNPEPVTCTETQELVDGSCVDKEEPVTCSETQELVDGSCVDKEEPVTCTETQELVDGSCVDKEEPTTCEEGYTLVGEDCVVESSSTSTVCPHLDDIEEYVAVWCDEFDVDGLPDNTKWSYDVGGHGWGNGELQYYTENDLDNARVEDGNLIITAIKENYGGSGYTSARMITKDKGDWLYGKIQVKAKLPSGVGTWPAIWMLPTEWAYGGWPYSGEIDIMEHVGYDKNNVYSTIHTGAYNHMLNTQIGFSYEDTTLETDFHVYEIEWEPGVIKTYIDGFHYASFGYNPDYSEGLLVSDAWPFDEEFHLILNIAVGGSWGGQQGVDPNIWPQEMVVDYVRVYQKDYAENDTENPSPVTDLEVTNVGASTAFVKWDRALDNNMTEKYEIYIDGTLHDTVLLNGYNLSGLVPGMSYTLEVVAVDFAGNKSTSTEVQFSTTEPGTIGKIEAEDYDVAVGIDIEPTTDAGGGINVGWTHAGDYLKYTLKVTEAGYYKVDFRVASGDGGGTFTFSDGTMELPLTTPATGGWQSWQTITTSNSIYLEEGTYTFVITFTSGGTNLNYFEFKKVS